MNFIIIINISMNFSLYISYTSCIFVINFFLKNCTVVNYTENSYILASPTMLEEHFLILKQLRI